MSGTMPTGSTSRRLRGGYEEVGLDGAHIQDATGGKRSHYRTAGHQLYPRPGGRGNIFQTHLRPMSETLGHCFRRQGQGGARISEPIRESVRMTGFERQEASDLALVLRTAGMPVDLTGRQSAGGRSVPRGRFDPEGLRAIALGFIPGHHLYACLLQRSGNRAVLALVLNLFIIISILSAFNLTLTLTSIAGIILTVGMAVDANVIVFERIKEEYRLGKSPQAAEKGGIQKGPLDDP